MDAQSPQKLTATSQLRLQQNKQETQLLQLAEKPRDALHYLEMLFVMRTRKIWLYRQRNVRQFLQSA